MSEKIQRTLLGLVVLFLPTLAHQHVQPAYQVTIMLEFQHGNPIHLCNGCIIYERLIATTANCIHFRFGPSGKPTMLEPSALSVWAGSTNGVRDVMRVNITGINVAAGFDPETLENDLALLILGQSLPLGVRPDMRWIMLDDSVHVNRSCLVNFFSRNSKSAIPNYYQTVELNLFNNQLCRNSTTHPMARQPDLCSRYVLPHQFSCEEAESFLSFNNDRGSGLVCNNYLVGLLSSVVTRPDPKKNCSDVTLTAMYMNIFPHLMWVYSVMTNIETKFISTPYNASLNFLQTETALKDYRDNEIVRLTTLPPPPQVSASILLWPMVATSSTTMSSTSGNEGSSVMENSTTTSPTPVVRGILGGNETAILRTFEQKHTENGTNSTIDSSPATEGPVLSTTALTPLWENTTNHLNVTNSSTASSPILATRGSEGNGTHFVVQSVNSTAAAGSGTNFTASPSSETDSSSTAIPTPSSSPATKGTRGNMAELGVGPEVSNSGNLTTTTPSTRGSTLITSSTASNTSTTNSTASSSSTISSTTSPSSTTNSTGSPSSTTNSTASSSSTISSTTSPSSTTNSTESPSSTTNSTTSPLSTISSITSSSSTTNCTASPSSTKSPIMSPSSTTNSTANPPSTTSPTTSPSSTTNSTLVTDEVNSIIVKLPQLAEQTNSTTTTTSPIHLTNETVKSPATREVTTTALLISGASNNSVPVNPTLTSEAFTSETSTATNSLPKSEALTSENSTNSLSSSAVNSTKLTTSSNSTENQAYALGLSSPLLPSSDGAVNSTVLPTSTIVNPPTAVINGPSGHLENATIIHLHQNPNATVTSSPPHALNLTGPTSHEQSTNVRLDISSEENTSSWNDTELLPLPTRNQTEEDFPKQPPTTAPSLVKVLNSTPSTATVPTLAQMKWNHTMHRPLPTVQLEPIKESPQTSVERFFRSSTTSIHSIPSLGLLVALFLLLFKSISNH